MHTCTPPHSFLPVSWQQVSSEQRKGCHSHVSLQIGHILCSTTGSNPQLSSSAHFRVSFWGLSYHVPLHHKFHMTWKCLAWQNLQISFSPLNNSTVLTKDALCEKGHGQAWSRENTSKLGGLRLWDAADCTKGKVSSGATSRIAWDLCLAEAQGSASLPGVVPVHTWIYIHKMHTKINRCFTTHTYITPLIASCGLCQKTQPILLRVSAFDSGGCWIRPWGCPVHSSVHSPTFLSVCLKRGHWCVSIMLPLPARYWDRSIKGNTTARFRGFQKLRSDSVTLRHWERHIYTKANFNCANLKMSLVVMDWMHFGKNCYFLPHYHLSPLHQCCQKVSLSWWPYPNFSLNTQPCDFTAQALRMGVLLLCCALKGQVPCCRTPLPRRGLFCG